MTDYVQKLFKITPLLVPLTGLPYIGYILFYYLTRPEGSPADKLDVEPSVSIVLPTYNEEAIVERKLDELVSLEYPIEKIEIVVVDSSDDRTPEIVASYFDGRDAPDLELIREDERRGLATALNEAYAAASNDVVVKTDCDSEIEADSVREAVANLADSHVGAVTGRNVEVLGGSEVERGYRDVQAVVQTIESHLDSTLIFHGPFSAFERELIEPIDPDSIADDTEVALKIRKQGKRVIFDPAIEYREAAHSDFRKRRQQKDRRGMGLIRLLWRQRDMVGDYGKYGRVVLPFNWSSMMVSPWVVLSTIAFISIAPLLMAGPLGLVIPAGIATATWLGSRDSLGRFQPLYALLDTQVSLAVAMVKLARGEGDGTWEIDQELRENF